MLGRRNWNIPKQVADFAIKTQPDGSTAVTVALPGATAPFFKATIKPVTLLSHIPIPFNTQWLGSHFNLVQPPLPAGDPERLEEVATTRWAELIPVMKGRVQLASITGGIGGKLGDREGFPAVVPWSVGGHMASVDLDFGVPTVSDTK
ncbi:hypothetical protein DXG03_003709 [Asterophora parasitica]|uniref:Uncharacterized protein n=1 Tax=Asterophora parasitica TaxID=117018 RepID=A0A9P7GAS1_9AGAR|nr:hypothetical protein DXG03_003709 [Asterophora parasitica]